MYPETNVIIKKQGFKYYIIDRTGLDSNIPRYLPYPDNFPSSWTYTGAVRIKAALEQSFKHGWMIRCIEETNKG